MARPTDKALPAQATSNLPAQAVNNMPQTVLPPNLSVSDASVTEGGVLQFQFSLDRPAPSDGAIGQVRYYGGGTATAVNGLVTEGDYLDYAAGAVNVYFNAGETTTSLSFQTLQDALVEGNETLILNVTSATGATIADGQGVGTIVDAPPPPPAGPRNVGINPDFTSRIGDTDFNGTPDVFVSNAPDAFGFSSGNGPYLQPASERGVMEFNIANLSGTLTSATLKMDLFSSSGIGVPTVDFNIFAYGADGVASLADFHDGVGVSGAEYNAAEPPLGPFYITMNTSLLQGIIDGGATHLGIRIQDNDVQEVGTHEVSFFRPHAWPEPLPVLDLVIA